MAGNHAPGRRDLADADDWQGYCRDVTGGLKCLILTFSLAVSPIETYLREISKLYADGEATEHSYRPALQRLLEQVATGFTVINEPKRKKYGMPDFVVGKNNVPIGHVECKDIGANLDNVIKEEQLIRYLNALPNLLLTDHISFRWYHNGELCMSVRFAHCVPEGLKEEKSGTAELKRLLDEFLNAEAVTVSTAAELAERMAAKARLLQGGIRNILRAPEKDRGKLDALLGDYREALIPDLSLLDFADMQAQTAAYGLFAARCRHRRETGPFTRQNAAFIKTNPFLHDVFLRIAGPSMDERLTWIADDLAMLLDHADMAAILEDFGGDDLEKDPVIHFYENFLKAYDPELRQIRGVYYTPTPVVSWIVRSVDYLLRERFGIADGLANTDKVKFRPKPNAETEEHPRVIILDPATGTGTFLCEVVNRIHSVVLEKGLGGVWSDYVREHLLPRLFGFEFLMAPYAICHLKLEMRLAETGADIADVARERRLHVYLTNTLGRVEETTSGPLFAHEIVREAHEAYTVKRERPVMVILGNPPYFGHSENEGLWIRNLLRGKDDGKEAADYFSVDGAPVSNSERNIKWLNDDYVKFIRFAHWRIEQTGEGVLGFITNHAWINNPTFRGMRESLLCDFDEIYILDLHGNVRAQEEDENVFDIQQGVAISLFIKRRDGNRNSPAHVFHADLQGERKGKFSWLEDNDVGTTKWKKLSPETPYYLFTPRDESLAEEYEKGWKVTDIFPVNSAGIVTARDKLTIHWTAEEVEKTVNKFVSLPVEDARDRFSIRQDAQDWKVSLAQKDLREHPDVEKQTVPILYRPFDQRFTWYSGKSRGFICRPRPQVMRHMLAGKNIGIIVGRVGQADGSDEWSSVHIAELITGFHVFRRSGSCLFPLYLYLDDDGQQEGLYKTDRKPNLSSEFVEALEKNLGRGVSSEEILHYTYAVLHSSEYRRRYRDFLKIDFPRIPIPGNAALFGKLATEGEILVRYHLMQNAGVDKDKPKFSKGSSNVEKVHHTDNKVFINQQQFFDSIPESVWTYTIGGYQPAQRWLKDRNEKKLNYDDVRHYRNICVAIAETLRGTKRIDELVSKYGGWGKVSSKGEK